MYGVCQEKRLSHGAGNRLIGGCEMDNFKKGTLGNTGLTVGRLGVAASYGAPASAIEEAFDRGCNYFYLVSIRCYKYLFLIKKAHFMVAFSLLM
jgi:hypothetical protein